MSQLFILLTLQRWGTELSSLKAWKGELYHLTYTWCVPFLTELVLSGISHCHSLIHKGRGWWDKPNRVEKEKKDRNERQNRIIQLGPWHNIQTETITERINRFRHLLLQSPLVLPGRQHSHVNRQRNSADELNGQLHIDFIGSKQEHSHISDVE